MSVDTSNLFLGTAKHYSRYRPRYPEAMFDQIAKLYRLSSSTMVADVGVGTGQIAIPLARRDVSVVGIDPQREMLAEAENEALREGVSSRVRFVLGRGEDLRLHVRAPIRLVTLGQSFHWLNRDELIDNCEAVVEKGGGIAVIAGGRATELHGGRTSRTNSGEPSWAAVVASVIRQFLGPPKPSKPWVCHEQLLARSSFSDVRRWRFAFTIVRNVEQIIGLQYSTSFCSPTLLGDRKSEFERVLRSRLLELEPSDRFVEEYTVEALCAVRE